MMNNILIRASIFIIILGIALGLPDISTIIIDFNQLGEDAVTIIRLGVVALGLGILIHGDV